MSVMLFTMAQGQQILPVNVDTQKYILKIQTEITFQFYSYSIYNHNLFEKKRQKWLKMCCFICPKSRNGFVEYNTSALMNGHSTFSVASTLLLRFFTKKTTGGK